MYRKCKRGKRPSVKSVEKNLVIGGLNPDGAISKWTTIKKAIRETGAGVWMMQETKCQAGNLELDGFTTYEHVRIDKDGGGLSLSALKELNPSFVRDGGDDVEAMTVNIHLKKITISMNTGYGPQEYDKIDKKQNFWKYLEDECERAKKEGNGFLFQGDLNSHLGPNIIPGDLRPRNENGKMFANFVKSNQLTIVNALSMCKGTTTWKKIRNGIELKSTIDFIVVCDLVLPYITDMDINSEGKHNITNFNPANKGEKVTSADHEPMWATINLKISPEKPNDNIVLNYKDLNALKQFKTNTSDAKEFSKSLEAETSVEERAEMWKTVFEDHCKRVFPKIRIRKTNIKPSNADKLIDKRNKMIKHNRNEDDTELKDLNVKIAKIIAEEERLKCHKLKQFCNPNGSVNVGEMWKLKKKLWPAKKPSLPAAKLNHEGKLVSSPNEVKEALTKEYKERLRQRPIHPKLTKKYKKKTMEIKLKMSQQNKSQPFSMSELHIVLQKLKRGKARDPEGWVRELFHPSVMGNDMKISLLKMLNLLKAEGVIPQFMRRAHIATIPKKNKSRLLLKNERGIFLVNTIRGIFMKLLFNRKSRIIDSKMSDSNIGGRKDKSCINHIWVVNGVIHQQLSSTKNPPITIQQYDYIQMFDGMELLESISDLESNSQIKDDTLHLIYNANRNLQVKVKTPFGMTKEMMLDKAVLQGEIWGPALASNQVDTFGKEMLEDDLPFVYRYMGYIPIPILGMIDDTIGITEAGFKACQMNSFMNVKTADKYLQFGQDKCKAMLVGKKTFSFHEPNLEVDAWKTDHNENGDFLETFEGKKPLENVKELTYLGVQISADGKNLKTIIKEETSK